MTCTYCSTSYLQAKLYVNRDAAAALEGCARKVKRMNAMSCFHDTEVQNFLLVFSDAGY